MNVRVATAAGTLIFTLTIASDRIEITVDETALGDTPDDRLKITVNELPVTVAPEAIAVLTSYLSLSEGPDINLN